MHEFDKDFYGFEMRSIVLGYIRPELDYTSRGNVVVFPALGTYIDEAYRGFD